MSSGTSSLSREASVAGAGTGTALASLISLMGDGGIKSVLLVLAPSLAIVISAVWNSGVTQLNDKLADWKIKAERKRIERILADLEKDPKATAEMKQKARDSLAVLQGLELEASKKRIEAVLSEPRK